LQVIHQPLYRPKQIRAEEYAIGRKIGLERVNNSYSLLSIDTHSEVEFALMREVTIWLNSWTYVIFLVLFRTAIFWFLRSEWW
jgi:hypothetical protein